MSYLQAVFSELAIQAVVAFMMLGLVVAALRRPARSVSRKRILCLLWAVCLVVLGAWITHQEKLVLASPSAPSGQNPAAVAIKGVVRYVPEDLYYRHAASMAVLIAAMLVFAGIYKLADVRDAP